MLEHIGLVLSVLLQMMHLVGLLDNVGAYWARTVSVATDDTPPMIGRKAAIIGKMKKKVRPANARLLNFPLST